MKANPKLITALDEALKYERTLADCLAGYHAYFARWRFHRLEKWFDWNACASRKRCDALQRHICELGSVPSADRYEFELQALGESKNIIDVFDYFNTSLSETASAYASAKGEAKDGEDATGASLCGEHQREVEDVLQRVEAKINKVRLIGPDLYLAHHMHAEG